LISSWKCPGVSGWKVRVRFWIPLGGRSWISSIVRNDMLCVALMSVIFWSPKLKISIVFWVSFSVKSSRERSSVFDLRSALTEGDMNVVFSSALKYIIGTENSLYVEMLK